MRLETTVATIQAGLRVDRRQIRLVTRGNPTVMLYDLPEKQAKQLRKGGKYIVTIEPVPDPAAELAAEEKTA